MLLRAAIGGGGVESVFEAKKALGSGLALQGGTLFFIVRGTAPSYLDGAIQALDL